MPSRIQTLVGAGLVFATVFLLWMTDWTLGVVNSSGETEWAWNRIRHGERAWLDVVLSLVSVGFFVTLFIVVAEAGRRRIAGASRGEMCCWLSGAVIAGTMMVSAFQDANPSGYAREKNLWVPYYPAASGYFFESRYEMDAAGSFLSGYEEKMAEGDVLHIGTHPPGLFIAWRALSAIIDSSPSLRDFVLRWQSSSEREAATLLAQNTRGTPNPLTPEDAATLMLGAWITQWLGIATLIPLFFLINHDFEIETAWRTALFWPLIPALAVFIPKSDACFPVIGVALLLVWRIGLDRRSWALGALLGLLFLAALTLTLAFLPIAVLGVFWFLARFRFSRGDASLEKRKSAAPRWKPVLGMLSGFVIGLVVVWQAFDLNLLNTWRLNFLNHAGFYSQFTRTTWRWTLINPVEAIIAVGAPIVVLSCVGAGDRNESTNLNLTQLKLDRWSVVLTWVMLWLSGKNSGEAARLWLVIAPWIIWLAATGVERLSARGWWIVWGVQAVVCLLTVMRVFGFHFA